MPKKIKKKTSTKEKKRKTYFSKFSRYNIEFAKILGKLRVRNIATL